MIIALISVAAIILLVGMIILQIKPLIESPGYSSPDYQSWQRLMRYLTFIGALLLDIGAFLILLVGPYAAISRQDLPDRVRRALLGMSTFIALAWLIGTFILSGSSISFP